MIEYPRHLHKAGGVFCVVESDEERDAKVEEGWSLQPVLAVADVESGAGEANLPAAEPKKKGKK